MIKKFLSFIIIVCMLLVSAFPSSKVYATKSMEFSNDIKEEVKLLSIFLNDESEQAGLNALEKWVRDSDFDDENTFFDYLNDPTVSEMNTEERRRAIKDYFYVIMVLTFNSSSFTSKGGEICEGIFRSQILFDNINYLIDLYQQSEGEISETVLEGYLLSYLPDFISSYKKLTNIDNPDPFADEQTLPSSDYLGFRNKLKATSKQIDEGTYQIKTLRDQFINMSNGIADVKFSYDEKSFLNEEELIAARKDYDTVKNAFYKWMSFDECDSMFGIIDVINDYKEKTYANETEKRLAAIELYTMSLLSFTIEYSSFTSMSDLVESSSLEKLPDVNYAKKCFGSYDLNNNISSLIGLNTQILLEDYDDFFSNLSSLYSDIKTKLNAFYDSNIKEDVTTSYYKNVRNTLRIGEVFTDKATGLNFEITSYGKVNQAKVCCPTATVNLADIVIPSTALYRNKTFDVNAIGSNAFDSKYVTVTSVEIGNNIKEIEADAFKNCNPSKGITFKTTSIPSLGTNGLGSVSNIYVFEHLLNTYKTTSGWSTYSSKFKAIPHVFEQPTYKWDDNKCTAKTKCTTQGCTKEITETVTGVYVKDVDATCETNEKGHYEATFTNSVFTKQLTAKNSVVKENTALGHHYSDKVTYTWNNDKCTATWYCDHVGCKKTITETVTGVYVKDVDATCETNEKGHYEVTFTNSKFTNQSTTKESVEKQETALGHHYSDEVTYTWNNDKCTATWHCDRTGCNKVETETVTGIYVKDTDATRQANEKGHYEATFTNSNFTKQVTEANSVELENTMIKGLSSGTIIALIGCACGICLIVYILIRFIGKKKR